LAARCVLFLAGVSVLAQTPPAESATVPCAEAELKQGVVVESVAKNSQGEKAGLAEGDVILSWARGDVKEEIGSPFDLSEIEMEQEPLGRVTLQGETKQAWIIGPGKWGVQARPNFAGNLLTVYRQGQELAKDGKFDDATARWRDAANDRGSSQCSWIDPWLLFHAAQTLSDKQR